VYPLLLLIALWSGLSGRFGLVLLGNQGGPRQHSRRAARAVEQRDCAVGIFVHLNGGFDEVTPCGPARPPPIRWIDRPLSRRIRSGARDAGERGPADPQRQTHFIILSAHNTQWHAGSAEMMPRPATGPRGRRSHPL
jgi:hypothetical protein